MDQNSADQANIIDVQPEPQERRPVTKGDLVQGNISVLDPSRVNTVRMSDTAGGLTFNSALEVMEFAKLMAASQQAIPPAFRGNPGMCLALTFQAVEWRMSPFAVAQKAYVVNDRVAFESQLVHAVIESRAPIKQRLRCTYAGEGPTLTCTVSATFIGEDTPHEYESPKISDIKVQNSPLWKQDPKQQLFYYASRSWARKWAPDVLLGIYTKDEIEAGLSTEGPPPNTLQKRLADAGHVPTGEGYNPAVTSELDQVAAEHKRAEPPKQESTPMIPSKRAEQRRQRAAKAKVVDHEEPSPDESAAALAKAKAADAAEKAAEKAAKKTAAQAERDAAKAEAAKPAGADAHTPQAVADRAEASAAANAAKPVDPGPQPRPAVVTNPQTVAEYINYAQDLIDTAKNYEQASDRYELDREMRDALGVPIDVRRSLMARMTARFPEFDQ